MRISDWSSDVCSSDLIVGQSLGALSPELSELLDSNDSAAIVQVKTNADLRTLAVKAVKDASGHVLTFDDITQQLSDQRRAAWSDVARRIAHEIKNPLTPIQLAAERLQRRYSSAVTSDRSTFDRMRSEEHQYELQSLMRNSYDD